VLQAKSSRWLKNLALCDKATLGRCWSRILQYLTTEYPGKTSASPLANKLIEFPLNIPSSLLTATLRYIVNQSLVVAADLFSEIGIVAEAVVCEYYMGQCALSALSHPDAKHRAGEHAGAAWSSRLVADGIRHFRKCVAYFSPQESGKDFLNAAVLLAKCYAKSMSAAHLLDGLAVCISAEAALLYSYKHNYLPICAEEWLVFDFKSEDLAPVGFREIRSVMSSLFMQVVKSTGSTNKPGDLEQSARAWLQDATCKELKEVYLNVLRTKAVDKLFYNV